VVAAFPARRPTFGTVKIEKTKEKKARIRSRLFLSLAPNGFSYARIYFSVLSFSACNARKMI
jgi:hypothetical protein